MRTFPVVARGVGRLDYTKAVERSTQPFITPSLRQVRFAGQGTWVLATSPWPAGLWYVPWALPQEDGSWGYEASGIVQNFFEIYVSTRTNHLITIRLERFASWKDYEDYIVAECSPQLFGYGKAELTFLNGIPSQKGSVYATTFGCWPDTPTYEVTVAIYGITSELTIPWME